MTEPPNLYDLDSDGEHGAQLERLKRWRDPPTVTSRIRIFRHPKIRMRSVTSSSAPRPSSNSAWRHAVDGVTSSASDSPLASSLDRKAPGLGHGGARRTGVTGCLLSASVAAAVARAFA